MRARARLVALMLLIETLSLATAPKSKRKKKHRTTVAVPAVPSEYYEGEGGCPYHRSAADATPSDLSEFSHELERDGRQPEALRCYAAAIKGHPSDAKGWYDLAVARQYADPPVALRFYAHGLTLSPTSFHYNQLGVMLRVAERQSEAVVRFTQAARMAPVDADPLFNLGGSHEALSRHTEALHAYRGALERERKNEARIQNNIGNVLGRLNRWDEALLAYGEAEEADPDFVETHQNLAHVFGELKRYDEADRHLADAARLLPAEAANISARREELRTKREERAKLQRQDERRDEINKRDGHLTREQRVKRFEQVVSLCGMDKACMKKVLQQEDAKADDLVVF